MTTLKTDRPTHDHSVPTLFSRPDRLTSPLYVVTPVFNSPRYRSRWRLYEDFVDRVADAGAILYTIEVAFGDRAFVTNPGPTTIQVRTDSEVWHKERALNLAFQRLPIEAEYIAWVDADIGFVREDWADETRHLLQHYDVIQMWSHGFDLDVNYEPIGAHTSFAASVTAGLTPPKDADGYYYSVSEPGSPLVNRFHPGFAWAARRKALNAVGGLIDYAILGSADRHMAFALVDQLDATLQPGLHPRYCELMKEWEARAHRGIRLNLGCMKGTLFHYWHGAKANRRYVDRWKILTEERFNPDVDLKTDVQGLWQLTGRSTKLRDRCREYFHQRDEDARS